MKTAILKFICIGLGLMITTVSCSQNTETPEQTEQTPAAVTETAAEESKPNLPNVTYGGEDFMFFVRSEKYMPQWYAIDIDADELTGEPINDAVYSRNMAVEEQYNVVIGQYYSDAPRDEFMKIANAGEDLYDVLVLSVERDLQGLIRNSVIQDVSVLPYVDYENPWWDNSAIQSMKLGDKTYVLESDLTIVDKYGTAGILFNKTMVENYQLGDLYALVREGEWTFDKMVEMSEIVSGDTNGDGKMGKEDTIGQIGEPMNVYLFMSGFGLNTAVTHEGMLQMQVGSQRFIDLVPGVIEYMGNNTLSYTATMVKWGSGSWEEQYHALFVDNRALFYTTELNRFTLLREFDFEFGVVPFPKSDTTQKQYITPVDTAAASGISVPITQQDLEKTAILLDALSYVSMNTLKPAFYDVNLTKKEVRDEESVEMLEIIFANRTPDIGIVYNFGGIGGMLQGLVVGKNINIASAYAGIESKCTEDIEALMSLFE